MYLQITTKCNMTCEHCCFNCTNKGRHANYNTIVDAIAFARGYTENISIGGGEPTLHPRFFDILKMCLEDFDYVGMVTNGSQTNIMYRLANIIDEDDYPEWCNCSEEDIENGYCDCYDDCIYQENKLSVELSQDCFHDPINQKIVDLWESRKKRENRNYGIRDITRGSIGVVSQGRAKKNNIGQTDNECVCADIIIKPNGNIKPCGCTNSPIIGNIWDGISDHWQKIINSEDFQYSDCYTDYKRRKRGDKNV